jgi:hypothetical protein
VLACVSSILGVSTPGCFRAGGGATLSPEDQVKAKEAARKRFDSSGLKQGRDSLR